MLGRLLIAALLGFLAGVWTAQRPGDPALFPAPFPAGSHDEAVVVYLLDNGFHTDLALPRAALARDDDALSGAVEALPLGDWVLVGWGDAVFYVDQGPVSRRLGDGARALFRPGGNPAVLRLEPIHQNPASVWPQGRTTLTLSAAGFRALRARVTASLALDAAGRAIPAPERFSERFSERVSGGREPAVRFYASSQRFWVGRACNHWTAEALNAAGLPMPMARSLWSGQVVQAAEAAASEHSARRPRLDLDAPQD